MPAETHMSGEPISRDDVLAVVREQISLIGNLPVTEITLDARFDEDLSVDGGALLEIAAAVEDEFGERTVGVAIDDEQLDDVATVGEFLDLVTACLGVGA